MQTDAAEFDRMAEYEKIRAERKGWPGTHFMTLVDEVQIRYEKWERESLKRRIAALEEENKTLRDYVGGMLRDSR